ncbi:MAG: amidohydrolase [Granulosicoccus sp.]|nr:amidohydrolase [Granulosicoccus sp.]
MLIDTHLHLIYRDKLTYPWIDENHALNRDSRYGDYATVARRVGIVGALHMEVDVADEDRDAETDLVRSLMDQPESLLRGAIVSCRPESTAFPDWLERQLERTEIKGFRRVLHVVPDDVSTSRVFRDNVRRLSGTGLSFDLCVLPRQIPLAIELIDHCPEVQFVLDHCGVPDIKANAFSPWNEHMTRLAERQNVSAKISGVMAYGDLDRWTLEDLRPYVEHTIATFGWDRVIWGSDSPVCTLGGQIETWVAATHALVEGCSREERDRLFHRNASRLWNIPSASSSTRISSNQ